ncbi:MAG: NYN domain-containing protein [Bacteroidetes bacterium]|nr:NYN domain-containing protein [Bacteroidota bacterium]
MTKANNLQKKERVIVYVDGFNLYFGLLEAGLEKLKWLNIKLLTENMLKANQKLVEIKYFTSRVSNNPDKQKRQTTYIEALESFNVKVYYGHYQRDKIECYRCGNIWAYYNEKMTDVNIATQMIIDAYHDKYDMAMLISGDSDLVPPIKAIIENFKNKRVFVAFPPKRHNNSVALVAKGSMVIGRKKLADSQFDDEVTKKDGFILKKPGNWK